MQVRFVGGLEESLADAPALRDDAEGWRRASAPPFGELGRSPIAS